MTNKKADIDFPKWSFKLNCATPKAIASGFPSGISDAAAFGSVDNSPIEVMDFFSSGNIIRATTFFEISVEFDDTEQYLTASFPPLSLEQFARTRQELEQAILEELDVLWRNIAIAADDSLVPGAKKIKYWLLEHFEGTKDAPR